MIDAILNLAVAVFGLWLCASGYRADGRDGSIEHDVACIAQILIGGFFASWGFFCVVAPSLVARALHPPI